MDLSRTFQRLGLAVALLVLASAIPAYSQTGGISGKVTLRDGTICVGCQIVLDRIEIKGTYKAKTNKKGQYIYIGIPMGNYKITLFSPSGQQLFYFNNRHITMGDPTEVDFDLAKEIAAAEKEQSSNPEYQKRKEQIEKEEKQMNNLKAVFNEGNALFDEQKYPEAAEKYQQALPLAKGKNHVVVLERLADTYAKAKENDKAIATYQEAIAADPTSAGMHNNLGNVYANTGKTEMAKQEFQKAAEIDPAGAAQYYFNLGAVLYNTGKMDDAAEAFKRAISVDAKDANAYFWLGLSLAGKMTTDPSGKVTTPPGTLDAFQKYLELAPNGPNAAAAKAQIQIIQGGIETQFSKPKKKKGR